MTRAWLLLVLSCEAAKVQVQSQGDGSCSFGLAKPVALACTSDACMLCMDHGDSFSCQWVTYRHCGP